MATRQILYAVPDDFDDITQKHSPDPLLLQRSRARVRPQDNDEGDVSKVRRPPPLPPRARLKTIPLESLRALRDMFADYMGPAARPLLLRAIAALDADPERFPEILKFRLVAGLARHFDDDDQRRDFLRRAKDILGEK